VDIDNTGSLEAFLGLDVSLQTSARTDMVACNGGKQEGTDSRATLDSRLRTGDAGRGLAFFALADADSYTGPAGDNRAAENGSIQAFGIGSDQRISVPGPNGVDLSCDRNSRACPTV